MKTKLLRRITVAIVAVLLITTSVASTYAIFVTDSKMNIAVTSGNVEIVAEIDGWEMHSIGDINLDTLQGTKVDRTTEETFISGGAANYAEGQIILDKIVPGDGVSFNIMVSNNSNVAIKYRTVISEATISNPDNSSESLINILEITINGNEYVGKSEGDYVDKKQGEIGLIDTIPVTIDLPLSAGAEWMNKSIVLDIRVEAVQSNIYVPQGAMTLSELKADIELGKGATAQDPVTIIGGDWSFLGSYSSSINYITDRYVVINGGEFVGENHALLVNPGKAVVTIKKGTFNLQMLAAWADNVSIYITGGEFTISSFIYIESNEITYTLSISGGKFSIDPTAYVADGYSAVKGGDGIWSVVKNG